MSENVILEIIKTGASLLTVIIGGIISIRLSRLHKQINSRMDQLLAESKKLARAEGKEEQRQAEK